MVAGGREPFEPGSFSRARQQPAAKPTRDAHDRTALWISALSVGLVVLSTAVTGCQTLTMREDLEEARLERRAWLAITPKIVATNIVSGEHAIIVLQMEVENVGGLPAQDITTDFVPSGTDRNEGQHNPCEPVAKGPARKARPFLRPGVDQRMGARAAFPDRPVVLENQIVAFDIPRKEDFGASGTGVGLFFDACVAYRSGDSPTDHHTAGSYQILVSFDGSKDERGLPLPTKVGLATLGREWAD